jgi:integration host factor subunit alpha|tara:strand:- start:62 stop:355 length:294 start_codon:yes stop_codon:yes gene_type:complete
MKQINLTKEDLVKDLSIKTGFSKNISKKLVDDFIISMTEIISKKKLILKNLGTFNVIKKKQRIGRNPKTKKEFMITARNSIRFIPSDKIVKYLNKIS